jgi:hypothetical protein
VFDDHWWIIASAGARRLLKVPWWQRAAPNPAGGSAYNALSMSFRASGASRLHAAPRDQNVAGAR